MKGILAALSWDVVVQARNGFYWATAFVVLAVGGLLLAFPEPARANHAAWVPALLATNLQITTFFFAVALILLEREEGTLAALAVTPFGSGAYSAVRTTTLTTLAAAETVAIVLIAFGTPESWPPVLLGTAAMGAIYTGFGLAVASRYDSLNRLLLPASAFVALLLLPLLPHFGLVPRTPMLFHPIEPPLALVRAAYVPTSRGELVYDVVGSAAWSAIAFFWGRRHVGWLMRDTATRGGR
jgi:fluoroquinolone transport system permease protein